MRVALLFCGLVGAGAVTAGGQTPLPPTVPMPLRAHVQNERFQIVTSVRGLPLGVRDHLQSMFRQQVLEIADPSAEYQASDDITKPRLPTRRLLTAGCSQDHCLVLYERGGYARSRHAALIHWTPAATRLEAGGTAPASLATVDDIRKALLTGTIKGPARDW